MRLLLSGFFKCSAAQPIYPGSPQIYGQTGIFAHFVRNRLFWSRTFTDRRPIFIDVSVTVRQILRADLQKRGFARKAALT